MNETRASTRSPAQPQMTLLGYKELSAWNESDLRTVTLFDIIFLPLTMGSWALSLARAAPSFVYVYIVTWLLLTFWVFLTSRCKSRMAERFRLMKEMEADLDVPAHSRVSGYPGTPNGIRLRWSFYIVAVVLGAAEAVISAQRFSRISAEFLEAGLPIMPAIHPQVVAVLLGLCGVGFWIRFSVSRRRSGRDKNGQ